MNASRALIPLDKKQLKELGEYQKGYSYISADFSNTILFFKPKSKAKHHVYFIPNFKKISAEVLTFAIYELLHEDGKNRSKIVIKDERTGINEFYFGDNIQVIYSKIYQYRAMHLDMNESGALIALDKKQLKELGEYQKGYSYISADFSNTVLFFKPKSKAKHHVYFIPNFKKISAEVLTFAIYELLHEDGKNRSKIVIKDERTEINEFYFGDNIQVIYSKIYQFRAIHLSI